MQTVILCGGKGVRAYPATETVPKALMRVGPRPVIEHVMRIFSAFGYTEFLLSIGYLGDAIRDHFAGAGDAVDPAWKIEFVDTGADAETGERIEGCRSHIEDAFFATYADGLGDIDLDALLAFHRSHPGTATVTTVPLPSQYGVLETGESGIVTGFQEKPVLEAHWINAGFFVFDPAVFEHWRGRVLESEVLPGLVEAEQLYAYRHRGFWKSMDTQKDQAALTQLWEEGAPWAARWAQR